MSLILSLCKNVLDILHCKSHKKVMVEDTGRNKEHHHRWTGEYWKKTILFLSTFGFT